MLGSRRVSQKADIADYHLFTETGPEATQGRSLGAAETDRPCIEDRHEIGGSQWPGGNRPTDQAGIREYLSLMWNDPDFVSSLMPVRDGVGVSVKVR